MDRTLLNNIAHAAHLLGLKTGNLAKKK